MIYVDFIIQARHIQILSQIKMYKRMSDRMSELKCPIKRQNLCHFFQDLLEAKYTFVFVMFPLYVMFVKRATEKEVICQRKLGSNTSEVRTNRILSLEMMKGGARLTLDLEGWCAIET